MKTASGRATYGFDAPGIMRGLLVAGMGGVVVGAVAAGLASGWIRIAALTVVVPVALTYVDAFGRRTSRLLPQAPDQGGAKAE